ncbi:MAG TPA: BON domain-containing protein [Candidatus Polarisedimenticolaceae bacterium]|nr:BON domain-containing protein [Candidatus Polarisedimenticolaceae bacterium]
MRAPTWTQLLSLALFTVLAQSCSSDAALTARIKTRLVADEAVRASSIEVASRAGIVTLTGTTSSEQARARALQLTLKTGGVLAVRDRIVVGPSGEAERCGRRPWVGERVDDAGITLSVKGRLLDDPLVRGLRIEVATRQGVVFLQGPVRSESEKNRAIGLTRQVSGVRRVEANLTVEARG